MMADGHHLKKSFYGRNSAADCLITVKFCVESRFSQNFGSGTYIRVPQNVSFVFLMQFGLWRVAAFVSFTIPLLR